ncbi:hypothetical protein EFV64_09255 [Yersinia enterocolitica]|nr:hypothetical protein [Yersinia enterocolitica]
MLLRQRRQLFDCPKLLALQPGSKRITNRSGTDLNSIYAARRGASLIPTILHKQLINMINMLPANLNAAGSDLNEVRPRDGPSNECR